MSRRGPRTLRVPDGLLGLLLLLVSAGPVWGNVDTEESWSVAMPSGRLLDVTLRKPAADTGPWPAIVLFGGFAGSTQILDYIDSERPLIRASFAYPWTPPESLSPWRLGEITAEFNAAVHDTLDGVVLLIDALRERADVDAERIVLVGASAGAPFATIAGQRAAVPGVIIVQGFGELERVIARQFAMSWRRKIGRVADPAAWLTTTVLLAMMDLPEPERAAEQFFPQQRVLQVTATDDQRIPATATEALWSAIARSPAQATRRDLPGDHLGGYGDPEIARILALALDWMDAVGLGVDPSSETLDDQ